MKHLFLKIVLIFVTTLNSSCEEHNTNESTGNDTFSCYINGNLYIPSAGTGIGGGDIRPFNWAYTNFDNSTNPYLFTMGSGGDYTLSIRLINPNIGQNILNEDNYFFALVILVGSTFYSIAGILILKKITSSSKSKKLSQR